MVTVDKAKSDKETGIRIFVSDCEGPISKNDNAYELASRFIPDGAEFFKRISIYDDVQADIVKRPGYKAGDTLKLILPFLKVYGATDQSVVEYSRGGVSLIPGASETLTYILDIMPSYIVSTSYRHYIEAVCIVTGFPIENTYSTLVQFDRYDISYGESRKLKLLCREISEMPMLNYSLIDLGDLGEEDNRTLERLDEIFWEELPSMECGRIISEVNTIGGEGKAEAVKDIVYKNGCTLGEVMYVGDSITDAAPLKLVREGGGISISFNGNEYALKEAEVSIISGTTIPTTALAYLFKQCGKSSVLEAASNWRISQIQKLSMPSGLLNALKLYRSEIPIEISMVTEENIMKLEEKSKQARSIVRGEAVGSLG